MKLLKHWRRIAFSAPSPSGALAAIQPNLATAETALVSAIQANDPTAISTAATQIGNLRAQEVTAQATASAGLYAILTSTQQATYTALGLLDHGEGFRR